MIVAQIARMRRERCLWTVRWAGWSWLGFKPILERSIDQFNETAIPLLRFMILMHCWFDSSIASMAWCIRKIQATPGGPFERVNVLIKDGVGVNSKAFNFIREMFHCCVNVILFPVHGVVGRRAFSNP